MLRRDCFKGLLATPLGLTALAAVPAAKPHFHAAICAYSFRDQLKDKSMTYADVIQMAADVGADGVDLTTYWLADTSDETLFTLRRQAYRSAISIYTVGIRARMAQPTPELRAAEGETVRKWLNVAERLGAGHIRIFGGSVPKGASEDQAVAWAGETMRRCAEAAGQKGITLGLEDDGGITTTAARTIEIYKLANSPWAGINLDIGNFVDDAYRQIELCAPYATNVHFKSHVREGGQSVPADWPRILKILGNAGYRGFLALEYEETKDPLKVVPELMARMLTAIRA